MTPEKKTDVKSSGNTKHKKNDEKLKEKKSKDIPPTKVRTMATPRNLIRCLVILMQFSGNPISATDFVCFWHRQGDTISTSVSWQGSITLKGLASWVGSYHRFHPDPCPRIDTDHTQIAE